MHKLFSIHENPHSEHANEVCVHLYLAHTYILLYAELDKIVRAQLSDRRTHVPLTPSTQETCR